MKQIRILKHPFTQEEIHFVASDLGTNTSPKPGGFTAKFSKKSWSILKDDIRREFDNFFENAIINAKASETYICFTPKKPCH